MRISLHANATTTPKMRALIQSSHLPAAQLSRKLGVSQATIRCWKKRTTVQDRSHCRHNLLASTSAEEEVIICSLRRDTGLGLDDLVEVMKRCVNASLSRSAIYRCLKRHGLSQRPVKVSDKDGPVGHFAPEPFGFVHVDLKHLTRLQGKPAYVFVAIERNTRFVHVEIINDRAGKTIAGCMERFVKAFGYPVHTVLTDNGSEFTDRFAIDKKNKPKGKPTGDHPFDMVCTAHAISHKLTRPYRPQTNGMVERFNRRLSQAISTTQRAPGSRNGGKNKFKTHQQRDQFIHNVVQAYNRTRLKCLNYKAPIEALNDHAEQYTQAGTHLSAPANESLCWDVTGLQKATSIASLIWFPACAGMTNESRESHRKTSGCPLITPLS